MIGLADFVEKHREAVERDLLTETGRDLDELGSTLSWSALNSFLSHIQLESALGAEMNPELVRWTTRLKTNEILADIYDQLSVVNARLYTIITKKRPRKPEPYERPGKKEKKRIGSGPLPVNAMREWIESKRKRR